MAKTTKPLTNTEVKQAKAKEKEYKLSDYEDLMCRVRTAGTKSWLFNHSHSFTKNEVILVLDNS